MLFSSFIPPIVLLCHFKACVRESLCFTRRSTKPPRFGNYLAGRVLVVFFVTDVVPLKSFFSCGLQVEKWHALSVIFDMCVVQEMEGRLPFRAKKVWRV